MNSHRIFMLSSNKTICFLYRLLFFITLAIALCASNIMRIGWSDAHINNFYHIRNLLWLGVYILLVPLVALSVVQQFLYIKDVCVPSSAIFYLIQIIVLLMCLFSYLGNKNRELFSLALLACLAWPIQQKHISLELFLSQILILIVGFLLLFLKITRDYTFFEHGLRHVLGFSHPNCLGIACFSIVILFFLYEFYEAKTIKMHKLILCSVIAIIATTFMYYYTKSRTSTIAIFAFLLLFIFFTNFKKTNAYKNLLDNKIICIAISLFPLFCFILALVMGLLFDKFEWYSSNFNYRFYEGIWGIERYGLTLFGIETEGFVFDNNYFRILIWGGIGVLLCYLFICCTSCFTAVKRKNWQYISFLIVLSLFQEMESYSNLWSVLFLMFSYAFSDNNLSNLFRKSDMNI